MKELTQIIGQLHNINEQIVIKDNMIDQMGSLVNLLSQLINDTIFVKSDVYLDLKMKYINQIEERLKKLDQSNIIIEPENLPITRKHIDEPTTIKTDHQKTCSKKDEQVKKHLFTKDDVTAPIRTDIFVAPSCRRKFSRAKKENKEENKTPKQDYISFDFKDQRFYINLTPKENKNDKSLYEIYKREDDERMSIIGNLKGSLLTLIYDNQNLTQSETINLRTMTQTDKPNTKNYLFDSYILDHL